MDRLALGFAVFAAYATLGTVLAVLSRRMGVKSAADYYVAGGRLGGFLAAMTYAATTYSAFMMVGLVGLSYFTGVGALGFELVYLVGTLFLLSLLSPKIYEMSRSRGWVSPAEMLGDLYGSRLLAVALSVVYLVALVPYVTAQLKGIGETIAGMSGASGYYVIGVLVGAIIVVIWTGIAGIWSVAATDALQGLWMISAAVLLVGWLLHWGLGGAVSFGELAAKLDAAGLVHVDPHEGFWRYTTFIGFTVPWFFFAITNPQVVQRLYMPKSVKALKTMVTWFAIFGFTYTVLVTFVGLVARGYTELGLMERVESRDLVTPTLLYLAPPAVSVVVFTSIVAAAVSTADSIILTLTSVVTRSIAGRKIGVSEVLLARLVLLSLVCVTGFLALKRIGFVVELSVLSSLMLLPIAPMTVAALTGAARSSRAALASLLTGFMVAVAGAIRFGVKGVFVSTVLGVPVSLLVLALSTAVLLVAEKMGRIAPRRAPSVR